MMAPQAVESYQKFKGLATDGMTLESFVQGKRLNQLGVMEKDVADVLGNLAVVVKSGRNKNDVRA